MKCFNEYKDEAERRQAMERWEKEHGDHNSQLAVPRKHFRENEHGQRIMEGNLPY